MAATSKSIMIVGVGGQGTLLASKLIGGVLIGGGYDVKVSEVHGMSQRGGSVVTYVRYGDNVASPVTGNAEADTVLAFELLEAARYLPCLKKDGLLIVNEQRIDPMPVIIGKASYPENIIEKLKSHPIKLISCDALKLAEEAGSSKAVNLVLIGMLAKHMDFAPEDWERAIRDTVPEKFREMNIRAFYSAYNLQ